MGEEKKISILVDTREQKPLWKNTKPEIHVGFTKLDVGDYTDTLRHKKKHAERKSPQDLYQSIIQNHKRFRNEILRAKQQKIKLAVFIECTEAEFYLKIWDTQNTKTPAKTLKKIITTINKKYKLPFYWCKGRNDMKQKILDWLNQPNTPN